MDEKELKHYLSILVELTLYPVLKDMENDMISKREMNNEQQKAIIKFINGLTPEYKNMSNRDEVIAKVLTRMGINTTWAKMKIEEANYLKKYKNTQGKTKETQEKEK